MSTPEKPQPSVIRGNSGFLFLSKDRNNTVGQVTGAVTLDSREQRSWRYIFETRSAWLEKRGIPYVYMAAPFKEIIYSDKLPEDIHIADVRPLLQIRNAVNKIVPFVYPADELVAARQTRDTYSPGDTHWNDFGAYVAYRALMREISRFLPVSELLPDRLSFSNVEGEGDLASKIGIQNLLTNVTIAGRSFSVVEDNRVPNIGGRLVLENPSLPSRTCLIFRDSFSTNFLQYLGETFGRVVAIWQPNLDYDLIERERPHIVISEQAERFMVVVPDDLYGMSHEEFAAHKKAAMTDGVLTLTPQVQAIHENVVTPRSRQDSVRSSDIRTPQPRHLDRWAKQHSDQKIVAGRRNYSCVVVGDGLARSWRDQRASHYFGTVLNLGVSGDRINNILWRFADIDIKLTDEPLFIVFGGFNNVTLGENPIASIVDLLGEVGKRAPKARIILVTLPNFVMNTQDTKKLTEQYNTALRQLAGEKGCDIIDAERIFASAEAPGALVLKDGYHISEKGYGLLTDALLALLPPKPAAKSSASS